MHLCVYQHQYFIYKVSVCQGCCRGLSRRTEGSSYGLCMCLHPIYRVTWEEAQAAISQQPLFAPQNEALQDNEHFKTATPTTPTTCLSQHSDIGRARQRESERESAGSVKAILSVSVSSRRLNSFHLHPLKKKTLITQSQYSSHYLPILTEWFVHRISLSLVDTLHVFVWPLLSSVSPFSSFSLSLSPCLLLSVSKQSGRRSKILITKS